MSSNKSLKWYSLRISKDATVIVMRTCFHRVSKNLLTVKASNFHVIFLLIYRSRVKTQCKCDLNQIGKAVDD